VVRVRGVARGHQGSMEGRVVKHTCLAIKVREPYVCILVRVTYDHGRDGGWNATCECGWSSIQRTTASEACNYSREHVAGHR